MSARAHRARLAALAALLLGGCEGAARRVERSNGHAVWLGTQQAWAENLWADLDLAGIGEAMVEAARLEGSSLALLPLPQLPRRTPVTAVIVGELAPVGAPAAPALLAELVRLRLDLESRGLAPIGFHFALRCRTDQLESYAGLLREVRKKLDRGALLSATFDASWPAADKSLRGLLAATDFVMVSVYGQEPAADDDPERWDLDAAIARARAVDDLGEPFVAGVGLQGRASIAGRNREQKPLVGAVPLRQLLDDPRVEFEGTFTFEGFYRQQIRFETGGVEVAGVATERTTALSIARPTVYHLSRLVRRLAEEPLAQRRGVVFERLPAAGDTISVRPEQLSRVLAAAPPLPRLVVDLVDLRPGQGGVRLRVRVRNEDVLPTAATSPGGEHNYVEVRVLDGLIGGVELGDFRQETRGRAAGRSDPPADDARAVRSANTLRLFYPMLEGGFEVVSGDVMVWTRSPSPRLVVAAHYLLPDGSKADIAHTEWQGEALATR